MTVMISGGCWSESCVLCIICSRYSSVFGRWLGSLQLEACGRRKLTSASRSRALQKFEIAEKLHSRSDHKPLRLSRPSVQGVMLEFEKKKKSLAGWSPQTSSQHHELHSVLSKHVFLAASVGEIQQALETVMGDVSREWECSTCWTFD